MTGHLSAYPTRDEVWSTARAMHAAEGRHGLMSDEWTEAYRAWSETRDRAIHAVEEREAA